MSLTCNVCEQIFASRDELGKLKRAFLVFVLANWNLQQLIVVLTHLWNVESVLTPARIRPT